MDELFTSGEVARQNSIPRWFLLYLIEKQEIPDSSYSVPGRRLFTASDIDDIKEALRKRHEAQQHEEKK